MTKISSNLTFFWKLFGYLWILYFLGAVITLIFSWIVSADSQFDYDRMLPFCFIGLIGSIFVNFLTARLKVVNLAGESLLVSDFRKQIQIPFSAISHVDEPDKSSLRRIKIILKEPSEFGEEIVFAPRFSEARKTARLLKSKIETNYLSL